MKQVVRGSFLCFLLLAAPAVAQPARELLGQVFHLGSNSEKVPEVGVTVTLVETGKSDEALDDTPPPILPATAIPPPQDPEFWGGGFAVAGEAVEAYRQALQVRTRESLPQQWAMTQNNLGNALKDYGVRQVGERREHLLGEAAEAYHSALLVFSREHFPAQRILVCASQADLLIEMGDHRGAAQALADILVLDPDAREISIGLATLLHDNLHEFPRALEVVQA